MRTKSTKRRHPFGLFIDTDPNARQRDNLPEEDRLVHTLTDALTAADAVLDAHGAGCGCDLCQDIAGVAFVLSTSRACVEGLLLHVKERKKWKAKKLARLVASA